MRHIDAISGDVVDVAMRMHRQLGPGLLESVYDTVLAGKLARMGYSVARQRPIDIVFEGGRFEAAFRIDLLLDEQLLTYLRLTGQPVGPLINFGGATLKEGLRRLVNNHDPSAPPRLCATKSSGD